MTGAITGYLDVAQLSLYAFWLFFLLLVLYLHRESKREGYPLITDSNRRGPVQGFPAIPDPKEYKLPHGQGSMFAPRKDPEEYELAAEQTQGFFGAPYHPTGDPLKDGVGPAAWAIRPQIPDLTIDGLPRIVPLRVATDWKLQSRDPDPRGKAVVGADGVQAGEVVDAWVDRSEPQVRYFEVALDSGAASPEDGEAATRVLVPITLAKVAKDGTVTVRSLKAEQFAGIPTLANPDQVTLQEEDRIVAYIGGGNLYATPERTEPWL